MPHTILHFAAEYPEKPHVPQEMKPSSMQKHRGQERKVVNQGQVMMMALCIFERDDSKIIGELLKEFLWQGRLKPKDDPAEDDDTPCRKGESFIGDGISNG